MENGKREKEKKRRERSLSIDLLTKHDARSINLRE